MIGLNEVEVAVFMVVVHGVAKAHLFISFGHQIINNAGTQDKTIMSLNFNTQHSVPLFCSLSGVLGFRGVAAKHLLVGNDYFAPKIFTFICVIITIVYSIDLLVSFFGVGSTTQTGKRGFVLFFPAFLIVLFQFEHYEVHLRFSLSLVLLVLLGLVLYSFLHLLINNGVLIKKYYLTRGSNSIRHLRKGGLVVNDFINLYSALVRPVLQQKRDPLF